MWIARAWGLIIYIGCNLVDRIEKYNAIKNVIDDWDPIDLYEIGASKGEYDFEI